MDIILLSFFYGNVDLYILFLKVFECIYYLELNLYYDVELLNKC